MITIFYDGTCGLCHRSVQFLLARDPDGQRFRYAPLQGTTASETLGDLVETFDSMVVKDESGELLTRGNAALRIGKALGGGWRVLATLARFAPRFLRDLTYDFIAKRRFRWFGQTDQACPLVPEEQRSFFLN